MNNRALLIAYHFPPQAASSGIQRTLSFSKHLGNHGWEPIVLSVSANAHAVKNSSQLASIPPNLVVKRAFALDAKRHMGLFGHYPEMIALPDRWMSWWFSAVPLGLHLIHKHKPAVLWSTFPIATAHKIGSTLHRLTGIPWVADFRDPMMQNEYPTSKAQRKAYEKIEDRTIHQCSKAVFTTHRACESYKQRFPDTLHSKFVVIENGYDEDGFLGASLQQKSTATLQPQRRITLLHSGVLYTEGRDPSHFFEAIARLKTSGDINAEKLHVILRATSDDDHFIALIKKYQVEDIVSVEPSIPYQEALAEMLAVDGLIIFQGTPFNSQVPAKIYEYFRSRKPILGILDPTGETATICRAAGFKHIASLASADAITPVLDDFIASIRQGDAYFATDAVIAASSRQHRASELARLFNQVCGENG